MNRFFTAVVAILLLSGIAAAQERVKVQVTQDSPHSAPMRTPFGGDAGGAMMMQSWERLPEGKLAFLSADFGGMGEPVKDAPYTATALTESTQTLSDGTHIVNKSSDFIARDGQGRIRREQTFGKLGALNMEPKKAVFISDPTAHKQFILNPDDQSARVLKTMTIVHSGEGGQKIKTEAGATIVVRERTLNGQETLPMRHVMGSEDSKQVKHEDLGIQVIEGVTAQGNRETVTIAAGEMGNDRPIVITSEAWYSQDLHTMVLHKHSDPRFGETVFRLTDIKRGEPDASLFQVPAGFKTIVPTGEPLMLEMRRNEAPKD